MALKLKHIGALAIGTIVLAMFQNCGEQVKFDQVSLKSGADLSSQVEFIDERTVADLDDLELETEPSLDVGVDPNDEVDKNDDGNEIDGMVVAPQNQVKDDGAGNEQSSKEERVTQAPDRETPQANRENQNRPEREQADRERTNNSIEGFGTLYRCVVVGNGKSQHIGLLDGKAAIDINTPKTLCMSKNACLNIMADVFPVQEAKFTGYCAKNKAHTHAISDGEALALVEALAN